MDFSSILGINKFYTRTVSYMNTVANYSIWKHRNEIRYESHDFDVKALINKCTRSVGARRHVDKYSLSKSYCVPHIEKLYELMVGERRFFPFDNG